jgi:hypothetical protein
MAKPTKPTKQQVAQAKARAGGNNPVKVTNAGLKKLGSAALIAASLTPAGRVVKGAQIAKAGIAAARGTGTAKKITAAEKTMAKDIKNFAKKTRPGTVSKMLDKLPLEEKRAYSQALRKSIPDSKKAAVYKPTKQATPLKSVKRTTDPINKSSRTDDVLEQQYAKAVKATKAVGGDPKKVKLTYNGRTIDYNGIR